MSTLCLHLHLLHLTHHELPNISLLSMLLPSYKHANSRALCNSLFNCALRKPSCILPLWSQHLLQISPPYLLSIIISLMCSLKLNPQNFLHIVTSTSRLIWKRGPLLLSVPSIPFHPPS
ncbi:hypothetical protein ID866_13240 [Astraeus odoratus]|nr:hypothetical protein ID866_13240 [Astraeus odoratus]